MKYIIIYEKDLELGIMFDEILTHKQVLDAKKAVSAGFCNSQGVTWGSSVSLGLSSRPQDTELLKESIERRT